MHDFFTFSSFFNFVQFADNIFDFGEVLFFHKIKSKIKLRRLAGYAIQKFANENLLFGIVEALVFNNLRRECVNYEQKHFWVEFGDKYIFKLAEIHQPHISVSLHGLIQLFA